MGASMETTLDWKRLTTVEPGPANIKPCDSCGNIAIGLYMTADTNLMKFSCDCGFEGETATELHRALDNWNKASEKVC